MTAAAPNTSTPALARPVTVLHGVGPERAAQLARLEIHTVEDLLLHRPSRYEDRRNLRRIADLQVGEPAIAHGKIIAMGVKWFARHTKSIFELILDDGTARLHCRWWNTPYMEERFAVGDEVLVFGKPLQLKPRTMDHPETEVIEGGEERFIHFNRIAPIYPLTEGLSQRWLRGLIWRALQAFGGQVQDRHPLPAGDAGDGVPPETSSAAAAGRAAARALFAPLLTLSRAQAVRMLHFPETPDEPDWARRRLALEEYIELQQQILLRRRNFESKARALPCGGDNRLIKPFLAGLGFKLTAAQTRVLRELRKDMSGVHPMRRLLQGDVGSGKTAVAACSALMAIESGYSVALMAPTEILAEQHFLNFRKWLEKSGVAVELRTGSHKNAGPRSQSGPALTIGTHALIQDGFEMENLGLVIIDEQHKFGVAQREQFLRKGRYPHLLIMTATPIPRTLGLTLYGELDLSVIDELPPGRGRVRTFVREADKLPAVWEFIRSRLSEGRQVYVVYPRVEESAPNGVKAVTAEFAALSKTLAPWGTGLLHGRLKPSEKEAVMAAFRENRLQVLLATSLIEVGVDVPNATVMLIESAEQFGLAQLHQLRGRIGRGAHDSYCILVAAARNPEARQRLRVLEQTTDGFRIAEEDLRLRGPGELLGQQQSGMPRLRFGDLATDLSLIEFARHLAAGQAD